MSTWEPVVGLEVHVQLGTASKMFCRCAVRFGDPPNSLVCPVCTGQPGTLPVLNAGAIDLAITAGLALGCEIDEVLRFDRKNYFYPDLPKGYQISQFDQPLGFGGHLSVPLGDGTSREVTISRAHVEEDSGKVIHPEGMDVSLVDLNRAGTPLLEIVSGPDLRSPAEAGLYLKTLRNLLRYAGVSECDMEKGSFRCDANVSLRPAGTETLGTRCEIKNLNSFNFVEQALTAEIARQTELLDRGEAVVQATLGFDPATQGITVQRVKENPDDYRYFPEPDLPTYAIDRARVEWLRAALPEAPLARRRRYVEELGLPAKDADVILAERERAEYFEAVEALGTDARDAASWILTEVLRLQKERHRPLDELATTPERLAELVTLVQDGTLSTQAARQVVDAMEEKPGRSPRQLAQELDLVQVSDAGELESIVARVIADETDLVERYRSGKTGVLNALLGAAMKASKGKANPKTVRELLQRALDA